MRESTFAIVCGLIAAGGLALAAAAEEIVPARRAELGVLLRHDCGSCHGLTLKGGLGSPLLPAALAERSDSALMAIILDGLPGTPMPRWRPLLSEAEARWLVETLRDGAPGR